MPTLLRIIRRIPGPLKQIELLQDHKKRDAFFLALLGIETALVSFWQLGVARLTDTEAFYAEIAREMWRRNDWLTPTFDYARFFDKPPLYYWLELVGFRVFGVHEFATRLPAA